jgi:hypothetical protein
MTQEAFTPDIEKIKTTSAKVKMLCGSLSGLRCDRLLR